MSKFTALLAEVKRVFAPSSKFHNPIPGEIPPPREMSDEEVKELILNERDKGKVSTTKSTGSTQSRAQVRR